MSIVHHLVSVINLGHSITACLSRFLPSGSREQRSNAGLLGIATRSVAVSSVQALPIVAVPLTKHYCQQAVNLYDALCCPDFPHLNIFVIFFEQEEIFIPQIYQQCDKPTHHPNAKLRIFT